MNDLKTALVQINKRADNYELYQNYYDGQHRLAFASEKFRSAFGNLFKAFADNFCPAIVDAVADRLVVTGFKTVGGADDSDPRIPQLPDLLDLPAATPSSVDATMSAMGLGDSSPEMDETTRDPSDIAWDIWQANHMDLLAGEVYQEAVTVGDSYVIVWPDPETSIPQFDAQLASQCTISYDPENRRKVRWGAKVWALEDGRVRANLYYPNRIEKYVTTKSTQGLIPDSDQPFEQFHVAGEEWPLPNQWDVVPIFHFANNARMAQFGRSDLKDVVPLQDALNKAVCDMLVGMEFTAFPQRWITGLEVAEDEMTGRPLAPFVPGEDRIWAVGDKDVKFGEFPASGLKNYIDVQENLRAEIGRVTGIPIHYLMLITGRWPSGEALRIAEVRLTNKILDRCQAFGVVWSAAFSLALKMMSVKATVTPEWKDPTPKSATDEIAMLLGEMQLGIPQVVLWKERGFTDAQIIKMQMLQKALAAQAPAATVDQPKPQAPISTAGASAPGVAGVHA